MKKLFILFALILGVAFSMNAQTECDTLKHIDSYTFTVPVDTDSVDVVNIWGIDDTDTCFVSDNHYLEFNLEGLDSNLVLALYVDDMIFTDSIVGVASEEWFDTIYNYDSIIRVDSVLGGHPGVYTYDTIYAIDSILTMVDEYPIIEHIFKNGYNRFDLSDMDTIHNIAMSVIRDNQDSTDYNVTVTNINLIYRVGDNLSVSDIQFFYDDLLIYPNPTNRFVHIEGEFDSVWVYNETGQMVMQFNKNNGRTFDMSKLKPGVYVFRFDGNRTYKVVKK